MKRYWLKLNRFVYKYILAKIIFLFNSELAHDSLLNLGEWLGKFSLTRNLVKKLYGYSNSKLSQTIKEINFNNPVGLAAGYDYEAKLPQFLPSLGFGFGTVGTITNLPYEGNIKPRLARLVKSKALLVNKGFKNKGIILIVKKLKKNNFQIPIGLSIGQTNTSKFSQNQAVEDIIEAFKKSQAAALKISYYELNISCPNLKSKVNFYEPLKLNELLSEIKKLNIKIPIFIKMPIDKTDNEALALLSIIYKQRIDGVIFGNLQKNRKNPVLNQEEIKKYNIGNFSGKPTFERSNELIELTFKNYKDKLIIIGCGGVFNAKDAYTKIKLGANLVQFVTGLIFEGPFLAAEINSDLITLLKKDKFSNISEAIGINSRS